MILTPDQRAIIQEICQSQEESFIRIMEGSVERICKECRDDGYVVDPLEIAEMITRELMGWEEVKNNPDRFMELLDNNNIGMIKHCLIQDYMGKTGVPGLWKKLNLYDKVNERCN